MMATGLVLLFVALAAFLGWYLFEREQRKTSAMVGGIHPSITLPFDQPWELYHNSFSLCSKKIRVCLDELEISYKSHHIDLIDTGAYENISRRFLKINPGAIVPVLVHEGHPVYESHDQLIYAALHSKTPLKLVPEDEAKRETMETWVHKTSLIGDDPIGGMKETLGNAVPGLTLPIFATMIESIPVVRIFEGLLFHRFKQRAILFLVLKLRGPQRLAGFKPMVKVVQRSFRAAQAHLEDLEACLKATGGPYIVGEQFTLADVGMMVIFDRLDEADWQDLLLTDARPLVRVYAELLKERPSFITALKHYEHPTVLAGNQRILSLKQSDKRFDQIYSSAALAEPATRRN
jgi:glutathione S-transferase